MLLSRGSGLFVYTTQRDKLPELNSRTRTRVRLDMNSSKPPVCESCKPGEATEERREALTQLDCQVRSAPISRAQRSDSVFPKPRTRLYPVDAVGSEVDRCLYEAILEDSGAMIAERFGNRHRSPDPGSSEPGRCFLVFTPPTVFTAARPNAAVNSSTHTRSRVYGHVRGHTKLSSPSVFALSEA